MPQKQDVSNIVDIFKQTLFKNPYLSILIKLKKQHSTDTYTEMPISIPIVLLAM